jgi:hypothetical protein
MTKAFLNLSIRIQFHLAAGSVNESGRQPSSQFSPPGLLQEPAAQSGADQMQLRLAHRSF